MAYARTIVKAVRYSTVEYARLKRFAKAKRQPVSAYIREMSLKDPDPYPADD